MSIADIRRKYEQGALDKPGYVRSMLAVHDILFDYPAFLGHTDIESIEISDAGVLFKLRKPRS